MVFENGVKNIQAAAYNGARMVISLKRKPTGSPKKLPGSPKEAIKAFRAASFKFFGSYFGKLMIS